jgi:hypothetical protein
LKTLDISKHLVGSAFFSIAEKIKISQIQNGMLRGGAERAKDY